MSLHRYFTKDDGSLPEIELLFDALDQAPRAFAYLFSLGAVDATIGGSRLWVPTTESEQPFNGPSDAQLVTSGARQPFHILLANIALDGIVLPEILVWVDRCEITLSYRMGPKWGAAEIAGFVRLLRELCRLGATISVPWWGADAERTFKEHVGGT